jgi:hypothetical protein
MRMRLEVHERHTVLAGANVGAAVFESLAARFPPSPAHPRALFVDFAKVELATASFLREAVLKLKAHSRTLQSNWYPVICNANSSVLEELEVVCLARSDAMLSCQADSTGQVSHVRLIGKLDQKQREAFEFVVATGGATARDLMEARSSPSEGVTSPTAWNNRLSVLVEKGLVFESYVGRQKLYTPILKAE